MTKEQFIELVKGKLTSADPNPDIEEKYDARRIELFISLAFNDVIYQVFARNLDEKDLYARSYTVDVEYDETYDQYYSDLPALVIQLPMNAGIHKISPLKEPWSFLPINQLSEDVFTELEVNQVCQDPSYYFNTTRVFYQYYDWKNCHIKQVEMDLIISFESYADTDIVIIPAGKESTVVEMVTQMLSQQLTADHTKNLNDTQA